MKHIHALRRCVQILVFLGFCILPWLSAAGIDVSGTLFALKLGPIPFADPVGCTQVLATGNWPSTRLVLGALLALVIALFLGRVFCSWLCPYGLLSELITRKKALRFKNTYPSKCLVFFSSLLLFIFATFPLLSMLSFPGELSLLPLLVWQNEGLLAIACAAALPILALLLEACCGSRVWCKYLCPQSLLLGGIAHLLPKKCFGLRIAWNAKLCTCKGVPPCAQACSLALNPRHRAGPRRSDCTHCCDCVKACASHGKALSLIISPTPQDKKQNF